MRGRLGHRLPILAGLMLAVMAWASPPEPAHAHARLAASDPPNGAALNVTPTTITLAFTEPVALGSVRLSATSTLAGAPTPVVGPAGKVDALSIRAAVSGVSADPQTLTVAYRLVSATDGHETTGVLIFSVGTGIPPAIDEAGGVASPRPLSVGLRAIALLGLALQAGSIVGGRLSGSAPSRRLAVLGAALAVVGLGGDVLDRELLDRQAGQLLILAAVSSAVVAVVAGRWAVVAVVPWLAAVAAVVAAGHAAGDADRLLTTALGTTHAALGLAWAGAVVGVVVSSRRGDPSAALHRLGLVALLGVAGLALAGLGLTALRVDGLRSLGEVTYGRLVLAKQLLLVIAVATAAANRLVLLPRLPSARWLAVARRVLTLEAVVLTGAIVVAGTLSSSPPADGPRAVPVATRAIPIAIESAAGDLIVGLSAAILGAEDDALAIVVTGPEGRPVGDIQRLIVTTAVIRPGEALPVGVARLDAAPVTGRPGEFTLPAASLAVSGVWTLDVTVRRAGVEDAVATAQIDTTGWAFAPPRLVRDSWRWPSVPAGVFALLATAAVVLCVGFTGVRRSPTIEPLPAVIILVAILAITAGFVLQGLQQVAPTTAAHGLRAPSGEPDLLAAAEGYRTYCLACHGADGGGVDDSDPLHDHGSGTNLLDPDSRRLSDGDLFGLTTAGVAGTTMPAYDPALTEQERWALVAYLRTLQRDRPTSPTPPP